MSGLSRKSNVISRLRGAWRAGGLLLAAGVGWRVTTLTLLCVCASAPAIALPLEFPIASDPDDGVEVGDISWNPTASPLTLGRSANGSPLDLGLRFLAPELASADTILFARLRFASQEGQFTDSLPYVITGALEISSPPMSIGRRPSQLPRTSSSVGATIGDAWIPSNNRLQFYYSDDLSAVLNEIVTQPEWGADIAALILCIDDLSQPGATDNFVACREFNSLGWPVTLEVCTTLNEAFICHETLGRPTDQSVVLAFTPLVSMEAYVEYGIGGLQQSTGVATAAPRVSCEYVLEGLAPGEECSCRLRYRLAGSEDPFEEGSLLVFRTQRPAGTPFTLTLQADSHIIGAWQTQGPGLELYRRALQNIEEDRPDFHISMGDFAMIGYCPSSSMAWEQYAVQRRFLDTYLSGVPLYLVLGNHEAEKGWLMEAGDSLAVWGESARRELILNPTPGRFYAGCEDSSATGPGLRESYYAWEWGDALFVVLDPFWYTTRDPTYDPDPELRGGLGLDVGNRAVSVAA